MPRRARSFRRRIPAPDPKFHSSKFAKFINYLMERGKKSVAQTVFYRALEEVDARVRKEPGLVRQQSPSAKVSGDLRAGKQKSENSKQKAEDLGEGIADISSDQKRLEAREIFEIALKNVCPALEVKGRRIGGSNYQVPMEVLEPRKTTLGMKWMITAARARKGQPMYQKLASEILEAFNRQGAAFKKMEDVQRMAAANRAFAHFARFGQKRK